MGAPRLSTTLEHAVVVEGTAPHELVTKGRGALPVRKQYYFRVSNRGLLAWDVDRLVEIANSLPQKRIALDSIRELDQVFDEPLTWRSMVEHIKLVDAADLSFPIILASDGAVMDGMHRVVKALRQGADEIAAVQFNKDPEPDYVGRGPEELPY